MSSDSKAFTEAAVWQSIQGEWRPLYGAFSERGISVEWHDFACEDALDWSRSFHPQSLELCVNLTGCGSIGQGRNRTIVNPQSVHLYGTTGQPLAADRHAAQRHQFLTIEMSGGWLQRQLGWAMEKANPTAVSFLDGRKRPQPSTTALSSRVRRLAEQLLDPPHAGIAREVWYHAKVIELLAQSLFSEPGEELFCQRQKRVARERVERVKELLGADLENPPSLTELSRSIGCSAFYLSRIFSQETGTTLTQYLRKLRLGRAAELLQTGRYNVTEAALAVGYNSLSHFSKAFSEMFGCCPCVYPLGARRAARG
ncbi:MAG TPA: AraC family transcriptional regulator [Chthoniobacterales bacterium]